MRCSLTRRGKGKQKEALCALREQVLKVCGAGHQVDRSLREARRRTDELREGWSGLARTKEKVDVESLG
jgi:hypothetical protein